MASRFAAGDQVQTPFGKGVVREARGGGRVQVDVRGRAILLHERDLSRLDRSAAIASPPGRRPSPAPPIRPAARAPAEIDLHGMTVDEALARVDQALNEALLADLAELRLIHGRSGGRIRAAVHQRLRAMSSVRGFSIDPRNAGVTIVRL